MNTAEQEFNESAEKTIEALFDAIEREIGHMAEADLEGGILNVELDDGRVYIINKHAPNRQIWLSSPLSGAHHFALDENSKEWTSTRDGALLLQMLEAEMASIKGGPVNLG